MKKSRVLLTAFAVALSLGSFQVEAKKSAVRKRFDASYDRVKKCFKKGDCTRTEAFKAARDLGAAALVAVGAAVVGGKVVGRGTQSGIEYAASKGKLPSQYGRRSQAIERIHAGAQQIQRPYDVTRGAIGRGAAATRAYAQGLGTRYREWRSPGETQE